MKILMRFWKYLTSAFVCLLFVASTPAEAQDATKIKTLAKELNGELTEYLKGSGHGVDLQPELSNLEKSIRSLRKKIVHAYVMDTMEDLTQTVKGVNTLASLKQDSNVINKAFDLAVEITKLQEMFPTRAARVYAKDLKTVLDANAPMNSGELFFDEFQKLFDVLLTAEKFNAVSAAKRRATDLDALIKSTTAMKEGDVFLAEFMALSQTLETAESKYLLSASSRQAAKLTEYISVLKDRQPGYADLASMPPLLKELEEFEAASPLPAIRRRTTALEGLLEANKNKLSGDVSVIEKLVALNSKIKEIIPVRLTPRIHIISASYGDLSSGTGDNRRCDATPSIVNTCQHTNNCTTPASDQEICSKRPNQSFAGIQGKTLKVEFACITAPESVWDKLEHDRTGTGVAFDKLTKSISAGHKVVCRR